MAVAKPSSLKKVQRAARAASDSRGGRERRQLGFPVALAMIVILGVVMVYFSRASRAPALPPQIDDHWHAAYAVYDCDRYLNPFTSTSDPDGIHSHQDGVIHIHPWNSSATGNDARFEVFFDAMGVRVTDDEISGPGIGVLEAGSDCNGEPTVIRAARFAWSGEILPDAPLTDQYSLSEEFTDDFKEIQLLGDREAFTIARIPAGATIPPPPEDRLATAFEASLGSLLSQGPLTDVDPEDLPPEIESLIEEELADEPSDGDTPPEDDPADEPSDGDTSSEDESTEAPPEIQQLVDEMIQGESGDGTSDVEVVDEPSSEDG